MSSLNLLCADAGDAYHIHGNCVECDRSCDSLTWECVRAALSGASPPREMLCPQLDGRDCMVIIPTVAAVLSPSSVLLYLKAWSIEYQFLLGE
ncbi:MAG: hypothetical protein DSM106950_42265 [Stigonema ocellatum SAG 48.90 = DSM 106950]|nr:hypothetical protein [Stigonema ocellatum SAG 48.90 = DSM 106950]